MFYHCTCIITINMRGGCPTKAIAVESLRLFPPLYVPEGLSAYFDKVYIIITINMRGGCPTKAIAVESLRLFPPLYVPDGLSAYFVRPSFFNAHSTTYK